MAQSCLPCGPLSSSLAMSHDGVVAGERYCDFRREDVRQGMTSYFDPEENVRVTFDTWLPRGRRHVVYVRRFEHDPEPPRSSMDDEELVASMLRRAIPYRTLRKLMRRAVTISGALEDGSAMDTAED